MPHWAKVIITGIVAFPEMWRNYRIWWDDAQMERIYHEKFKALWG